MWWGLKRFPPFSLTWILVQVLIMQQYCWGVIDGANLSFLRDTISQEVSWSTDFYRFSCPFFFFDIHCALGRGVVFVGTRNPVIRWSPHYRMLRFSSMLSVLCKENVLCCRVRVTLNCEYKCFRTQELHCSTKVVVVVVVACSPVRSMTSLTPGLWLSFSAKNNWPHIKH